ncbi:MAG: RdgB/HAM1 family non-canonical purine NTP pyrophosphatase [Treponema sp.]|jgi:XTP/dITP diphosphohydrolase|nr:RdgB/HAM1 family non-canonical purine NTP pyrophosphatase [Treponema sp.]
MPERPATVWFATGNVHKKQELAAIFAAAGLTQFSLKIPVDGGIGGFDPEETGSSFVENSLIKARALYQLLAQQGIREPVIADDSGLCVDVLGGRPGIYSARYGGRDPAERNRLLLEELGDASNRRAQFVCAMVLLYDENRFACVQETLEGEIVAPGKERGLGGFGYDPILYLPALGRTVAELGEDEKNRLSHRGKAAQAIVKLLRT